MSSSSPSSPPWRRGPNGLLGGVCCGFARQTGAETWVVRLAWILSVLLFGVGLLPYLIAWASLPRMDDSMGATRSSLLGVCARIARRGETDVAIVRLLACLLLLSSAGTAVVGYVALYFLLPEPAISSSVSSKSVSAPR